MPNQNIKPIDEKSKVPNCPKCNGKMLLRTNRSKGNKFWGCAKFPKCRGTKPHFDDSVNWKTQPQQRDLKSIPSPSKYQKEVFLAVESCIHKGSYKEHKNLIVFATAGSGKTSVQEHVVGLIKKHSPKSEIVYLVYNSHVQREAKAKGLPALTTHSKFFRDLTTWLPEKPEIKNSKVKDIVADLIPDIAWDLENWMIPIVADLVSKVKNTLCPTDDETLMKIADKFGIELNGSHEQIFDYVRRALEVNNNQLGIIDFDDMMYLVWKHQVPIKQYDWVLGDECQDWNRLQIELIKKTIKEDGHALTVGDANQAMYGFRGADINAMDNLKNGLDALEMPLSISYRCGKSHVGLINQMFPEIDMEEFEGARDGTIEEMSSVLMMGQVKDGDLVLCRTNAPLVKPVFSLIRQGVKATIRGRDIGRGLLNLIYKFEAETIDQLIEKLTEYQRKEVGKLLKAEKNNQAASLIDKVETIFALMDGCDYIWQIEKRIEEVFSETKEGVVFSTVHRAKGDEADNVYILLPQLMPHNLAVKDWEICQEKNILFVAFSRSKNRLIFVDGPAPTIFKPNEFIENQLKEHNIIKEDTKFYHDVEFGIDDTRKVTALDVDFKQETQEIVKKVKNMDWDNLKGDSEEAERIQNLLHKSDEQKNETPVIPDCPF